jgi:hypothetical protein
MLQLDQGCKEVDLAAVVVEVRAAVAEDTAAVAAVAVVSKVVDKD